MVNHYHDILIKSHSGAYTQVTLKVESDANEDYHLSVKSTSANACTYNFTIEAVNSEITLTQWNHRADKKNWSITQLPNGFYQTDVSNPENDKDWHDITRRETMEGAEAAINGSVEHFENKLEATKGPKVVKTFK